MLRKLNFENEHPASTGYQRKLHYPDGGRDLVYFKSIALIFIMSFVGFFSYDITRDALIASLLPFVLLALFAFLFPKAVLFYLIDAYQCLAPTWLRMRCRHEPSCSEYFRLAVERHGLLRGTAMGIKRINRCRPPNGGTDCP